MQGFTLSSTDFSNLQKRLLSLPSSDKGSTVTFLVEDTKVKVFYNNKVDKAEVSSLFYEELNITNVTGNPSLSSSLISNFSSIKIPDSANLDKFPQCKEVKLTFTDSVLTIEYSVKWNKHTAPNNNKLNFALIESPKDLKEYDSLFSDPGTNKAKFSTSVLLEAIQQTSFIKSDANSKDANGCFFDFKDEQVTVVSTDSSLAVKYKNKLLEKVNKGFSLVLSNNSLSSIRNFILDTSECNLYLLKSGIFLETQNRKMILPRMSGRYIISDYEEFFNLKSLKSVACLDLKPLIANLTTVTSKSSDIYKKVTLTFDESRFDLKTQADYADNIPCTVINKSSINVNGDFLTMVCQRVLTLDIFSNLYFDENTDRLALTTEESDKLMFLIQGLSF